MKKINFQKDILPHLIALVIFIIVVVVFYHPVFFENKELSQHDVLQGVGGGKELIDYREKTGQEGLWTDSMFGGMPGYLINTQWSGDLLKYIYTFFTAGLPAPARHTFMAMVSFYILLLAFRVRPFLAIAGALAFGLNSFNIIGLMAGHVWRIVSIAFMPLVIAGVHLTYHKKTILGLGLTAIGLGLHIRSNHLQMTYYLLIILIIYFIVHLIFEIKKGTLKPYLLNTLLLLIPLILALGSNAGKIWTVIEYSQYSTRGQSELSVAEENSSGLDRDYTFQYSNSIFEPLTMAIPNIMGGASQQSLGQNSHLAEALSENGLTRKQVSDQLRAVPTYWGKQPVTAPYYAGIVVVFLFILSLFIVPKPLRYWLITVFIISVVLSWGDNFKALNYFIFDHLPGYDKFRSVTFTLVMAFVIIPLGAMVGLEEFLKLPPAKQKDYLKYAVYITGGMLVAALLYSWAASFRAPVDERLSNVPQWFIQALREDRARLLRLDVFRNLFFASAVVWILWMLIREKLDLGLACSLLIILTGLDVGLVSDRYITDDNYERNVEGSYFTATAADERMMAGENEHFRVLNLQNPFNESRTSYFHNSIGGYHGAKMQRYQDLVERHISGEINEFVTRIRQGEEPFEGLTALNMLNTRYFYYGEEAEGVFRNPDAMGNAWFVSQIIAVNSPDEEIEKLEEINPATTCLVDVTKFDISNKNYAGEGSITLVDYNPNQLIYQTDSDSDGFAVFSEIYYPVGWEARIDGDIVDIIRANYILRALEIPAGEHRIEFEFRPPSYFTGNKIMLITSIGTFLFFGFAIFYELKSEKTLTVSGEDKKAVKDNA